MVAMHEPRIARLCYVSTLCFCSWCPQTASGAGWLSPQAYSSVTCTTCRSPLARSILQGEKWSEEVTWDLYCSFQPNDHMFPFSLGLLPYQGLGSARCWALPWEAECSRLPGCQWLWRAPITLLECSTHFRNDEHLPVPQLGETT